MGLCSLAVDGLPTLLNALQSPHRQKGQGIITVSNHISVLDDPLSWGILPAKCYLKSSTTRWALGASDIMFTNPVFSAFFRHGQVLETFRGKGVYQHSVDVAIDKLNQGGWVHLFPEGKVNQSHINQDKDGLAHLPRFKWGIGRMLMETKIPPVIIPVWLTGFEKLMPEGRPFPSRYIPRLFVNLGITFGEPLPCKDYKAELIAYTQREGDRPTNSVGGPKLVGWLKEGLIRKLDRSSEVADDINLDVSKIRSEATAIVQRGVEALGRKVSGNLLGRSTTV